MTAHCIHLRDRGQEGVWRLLDEVRRTPAHHEMLAGRRALCLLAEHSPAALEDRLSFGESLRAGGAGWQEILPEGWLRDMDALTLQAPLYAAHADMLLVHGLEERLLTVFAAESTAPVLNMGNAAGHPALALADLALMHESVDDLSTLRVAWVGGLNGLAFSLMEAAMYVPFELFMAIPEWSDPDHGLLDLALRAGAKIFLSREPALVLDGAHFVYCGAGPRAAAGSPLQAALPLRAEDMALALPEAHMLTAESLSPACRAEDSLLEAARPLWTRRLQMRTAVQTLLLRDLLEASA